MGMIIFPKPNASNRKKLRRLGFHILGPSYFNPEHVRAKLPKNWQINNDEPSHYKVHDDKGRLRLKVYRGISPHIELVCRYEVIVDYHHLVRRKEWVAFCFDNDTESHVFVTEPVADTGKNIRSKIVKEAIKLLDRRFPSWQDPESYWE
jgi:hypothetical protein